MSAFALLLAFASTTTTIPSAARDGLANDEVRQAPIPARFQGVWDGYPKACELAGSDMRLYVNANGIRLGDTVGDGLRVVRQEADAITMRASFRSDGGEDQEELRLVLSEAGNKITVHIGKWSGARYRCPVERAGTL